MSSEFNPGNTNKVINDYGHCYFEFKDDYCHIYDLYIKPLNRNKGNARKLLNLIIDKIRQTNWNDEIQIVCNPTEDGIDKERLSKFYKSLGLTVYKCYM